MNLNCSTHNSVVEVTFCDLYIKRTVRFADLTNIKFKIHLLSLSQEALRTGVPAGLLVVVSVGAGCSGKAGQGLDSLSRSSLGSGMLPMPVEALPTE